MTPGDVEQLAESGLVEDAVEFLPNPLVYMVHCSKESTQVEVSFRNGWVTVTLPEDRARTWAASDDVGIEGTFRGISVLIEKDWACLHSDDDKNKGTFPHPSA
jgi:hypothetical protein